MADFLYFGSLHKKKAPQNLKGGVQRILLLAMCGIGDAINYLPSIKAIRSKYPEARIVVVVASHQSRNIIKVALLDVEVVVYNRFYHHGILSSLRLLWEIRRQRFDLVMSRAPRNSVRIPLVAFLSGARWRVGASSEFLSFLYNCRVDVQEGTHSIERYRQLLAKVGIKISSTAYLPSLEPPKEAKESAMQLWKKVGLNCRDRVVAFCSGADVNIREKWNPSLKRWGVKGYADVARWLVKYRNVHVVIFGDKKEASLAEKISSLGGVKIVNLCGKTSIGEIQWLLKSCLAVVCNDTGMMHLAASLGIPVVALFGPTSPVCFGPIGDIHRIVQGKAHCSPCYPHPTCGLKRCLAMDAIKVKQVINSLNELRLFNNVS